MMNKKKDRKQEEKSNHSWSNCKENKNKPVSEMKKKLQDVQRTIASNEDLNKSLKEDMETTKTEGVGWRFKKRIATGSEWLESRQKRSKMHVIWVLKGEKQNNETEVLFKIVI